MKTAYEKYHGSNSVAETIVSEYFSLGKAAHKKKAFQIKKDTHIEVLSHSISDLSTEVLWRLY